MPEDSLTLRHYKIEGQERRYRSREEASTTRGYTESSRIIEHAHAYRVGDEVEVYAYGAWRPGKVVSLRRMCVVVHYQRNRQGRIVAKSFHGAEVRPRGEGRWVQS